MKKLLLTCTVLILLILIQGCMSDKTISTEYTVHYYLNGTTTQLAYDKMITGCTVGTEIIEYAIPINGHTADGEVKRITLQIDSNTNVITFFYTPNTNIELLADTTIEGIENFFGMTKDEVIRHLGKNYEVVNAGAEGSYEGYHYESYGLILIFQYNGIVIGIDGTENFEVNGARAGMNFEQIQKHLGEAEIMETWIGNPELLGNPDFVTFKIEYLIGKCKYSFYSSEPEGTDSFLSITKDD